MVSRHSDLSVNLTFLLGFHGLPNKKKIRFLFGPDDFQPPKLCNNLDVFYLNCQWRGRVINGEPHPNCLRGSAWPLCPGIWEIWGERWSECYVVSAISKPLEKWQKVQKLTLCGIRGESITWTMVWKSPFSNLLHQHCPWPPKGGSIKTVDIGSPNFYGVHCKIEETEIWFHPSTKCRIAKFFKSW